MDFINYIDTQIQLAMKVGNAADQRRLTGLRSIKSEYVYAKGNNKELSDVEIITKMYKVREETAALYLNVNEDLRIQEIVEMNILEPFLPPKLDTKQVIEFLNTLEIDKEKKNFRKFQVATEEHFGQKVDSSVILDFIDGKIS